MSVFWHRFRKAQRGKQIGALTLVLHLLGWLAAQKPALYALDLMAIIRGEVWRLIIAPFLVPSIPLLVVSAAILLGMTPTVVQRLGIAVFSVLCAGVVGIQSLIGVIALIATEERQLLYPVPPIVLFVLMAYALLVRGSLSLGAYRMPRQWLSLLWVLGIIVSLFAANVTAPALELVLISHCCIAGAFALLAGALAHHREIAEQFRALHQPVTITEGEEAPSVMMGEGDFQFSSYRDEAEYADVLLEKIFQHGEASLTEEERAFLQRYSQRI